MKRATVFTILFAISAAANAQPLEGWRYRLDNLIPSSVMTLSDGGCVLAGSSFYYTPEYTHIFARLTLDGDTAWIHRRRSDYSRFGGGVRWLAQKQDGSLTFVAGDDNGVFFGQLTADGTMLRSTYVLAYEFGHVEDAAPTPDGGGIMIARSHRILRCDSTGGLVWNLQCSEVFAGFESPYAVCATPDSGYLFAGTTDYQLVLAKMDSAGQQQWVRHHDYWTTSTIALVVKAFPDLGLFVAGGGSEGPFVARVDTGGDTLWFRRQTMEFDVRYRGLETWPNQTLLATGNGGYCSRFSIDGASITTWQLPNVQYINSLAATDGGAYGCGNPTVIKLCSDNAAAGSVAAIQEAQDTVAFRLSHIQGEIESVRFHGLPEGTTGWTTGAAVSWTVSYSGDTVVFHGALPLTDGVMDTFWLSERTHQCSFRWSAGCRADTAGILHANVDGLEFTGANYGFPTTDISIHVDVEYDIVRYEIWGLHWSGAYQMVEAFTAANDSGPHDYLCHDPNGHTRWLLTTEDIYGCRYTFSDRILILGQNVPAADPIAPAPLMFSLSSFPNPFNPSTTLSFSLPREGRARIAVFDILGREVAVLADDVFTAGEHRIMFDGSSLPSGLYFARLQSGNMQATHKLLLMK
jgi:hypothetical protein